MKILYVSPGYYPRVGGVEYVVKSVAERLAKMGHEVAVVAGEPEAEEPREEEVNGVRVVRWPTWSPSGAYHLPRRRRELEKLLAELAKEADVAHVHSAHAVISVLSALHAKRAAPDTKLVLTLHYHGTGHTAVRKLLWIPWRRLVAKCVEAADAVHAVSRREAELVASHYPSVEAKLVVIPHGVDEDVTERRWRGQESDYMMYAGRIEKYKRLELAVELAKEMGLKLLIVGEGPHKERLRKYAEKSYRGMVSFLPPQPRAKYLDLLAQARYAVNPSKQEAFSMFAAEALAMGTPAIVSREIAENIKARVKPFTKDLVIAEKAVVKTWNEIIELYLRTLFQVNDIQSLWGI